MRRTISLLVGLSGARDAQSSISVMNSREHRIIIISILPVLGRPIFAYRAIAVCAHILRVKQNIHLYKEGRRKASI